MFRNSIEAADIPLLVSGVLILLCGLGAVYSVTADFDNLVVLFAACIMVLSAMNIVYQRRIGRV